MVIVPAQEDFFCDWKAFRLSLLTITSFSEWLPYSSSAKPDYTICGCFFVLFFKNRDGMARPAKQNIFTHNASVSTRVHFLHVSTDKNRHEAWNCATCYININITLSLYIYLVTVFLMSSWRHFCYFSLLSTCQLCSGNVEQELKESWPSMETHLKSGLSTFN